VSEEFTDYFLHMVKVGNSTLYPMIKWNSL